MVPFYRFGSLGLAEKKYRDSLSTVDVDWEYPLPRCGSHRTRASPLRHGEIH